MIAYIDVIGLKMINGTQGHAAGDRLLSDVVAQIRVHLRPYDLIIRLGGDEFLCVMSNLTPEAARKRFAAVAAVLSPAPHPGAIRTGFAALRDQDTPAQLIARADGQLIRGTR